MSLKFLVGKKRPFKGGKAKLRIKRRNKTIITLTLYDVEIRKVKYQWQQPRQSHVQKWRLEGVHPHSETKHIMVYQYTYLWRK